MVNFPHRIFPSILSEKSLTFSFSEALKKIGASKDFRLYPHKNYDILKINWGHSSQCMIFYSTKIFTERQSNIREFFPGAIPEIFSFSEALINGDFSPIKSFHPSSVKNHKHFHFLKLRKNSARQRIFGYILAKIMIS